MDDPDLDSLRAMLLAPEQRQLETLRARIDDEEARADDVAAVLPRVLLEHAQDPHFTRALTPPLERAITASVHQNPKPLADALFPVMGPAIRKAVSAAIASMVESLNRTLDHSLSGRSIRWRLEAMRTGKTFAEIVLIKTLLYRVEQVFLIDRRTGLLLQHVRPGHEEGRDADMISGMLTAIRDFVRDSFRVSDDDALEALKVGDLSIWIEPGPHAVVASVIRGTAPREYRRTLQDALETIHLQFGRALETFDGDAAAFEGARPTLETCLQSEYKAEERRPRTRGVWLIAGAVVVALLVWGGFSYVAARRASAYLARLAAEPGVIVMSSERRGGRLIVSGLRDPLARDPMTLVADTGLAAADIVGRWAPYYALDPPLVLARARAVLQPPVGVTLDLSDGVLHASGAPPSAWVAEARRVAPLVPGVLQFDAAGALEARVRAVSAGIESIVILFVKGTEAMAAGQDANLRRLVDGARELDSLAAASDQRVRLDIVGHTDTDGPDDANLALSRARAGVVAGAIGAAGPAHLDLAPAGVGSQGQSGAGADEAEKQRHRSVTVHVSRGGAR